MNMSATQSIAQMRYSPAIDARVAQIEGNGAVTYMHTDRAFLGRYRASRCLSAGSVVAMSDSAGTVTSRRGYGTYGETDPTQMTGTNAHPFGYTGRRWDPYLGLYYYRARWYDPQLGTFLQTDPIGSLDYVNLYAYVGAEPGNATDPSGLGALKAVTKPIRGAITASALKTLRQRAVSDAWRAERRLLENNLETARDWSPAQRRDVLAGRTPKDQNGNPIIGHHINDVQNHPELAGNPNNIEFMTRAEHAAAHRATGGTRGTTSGPLIDRTANGRFPSLHPGGRRTLFSVGGAIGFNALQFLEKVDPTAILLDPDWDEWEIFPQ